LAEGSVLYRAGGTVVLATASIDESVPDFLAGKGKGWITADYQIIRAPIRSAGKIVTDATVRSAVERVKFSA